MTSKLLFKYHIYEADESYLKNENSLGKVITKNLSKLKLFWQWFSGSKVIDSQGRPILLFHGSPTADFSEFDISQSSDETLAYGKGVYMTASPVAASGYARSGSSWGNDSEESKVGGVFPLYANIKNPFNMDKMYALSEIKRLTEDLNISDKLKSYESEVHYDNSFQFELINDLEDQLIRLERGDKQDFYEISGYEEYQYIDDDGVFDEAEFESDLRIEINKIQKRIEKINSEIEESNLRSQEDLNNKGLLSGKALYDLIYKNTEEYHDWSIERTLIGGNSSMMEFKTVANNILRDKGYDGIMHLDKYNPGETNEKHLVYIAFSPDQVKFALELN